MTRILRAALTDGEISLTEHERLVAGDAAGAVVGFAGIVRNHDGGREVLRLEYSAHPHAEQILFEVLAEVAAFDTCARLVDIIKARLPVWKHQFFADGTDEWVNSA